MKYPKYNFNEFSGGYYEYTTPCPFGLVGQYTQDPISVGTLACQRCKHFKGINTEDRFVSCGIK